MRALIQRVKSASVCIDGHEKATIQHGFLVLIGIEDADDEPDVVWLCQKIAALRVFDDSENKMNCSIQEVNGNILLISQFTLFAQTKKGNRPSFIRAARPEKAVPLYEKAIAHLELLLEKKIETGTFGANMQVTLTNDGPVTIMIDSKVKE